jgi:two-component system sensor histidine kinase SenX3
VNGLNGATLPPEPLAGPGQSPTVLLTRALDELEAMVVIVDAGGREVFRNRAATGLHNARHGDALIAAALGDALDPDGRRDGSYQRELDLLGPPRRRLMIRGETLRDDGTPLGRLAVAQDISEQAKVVNVRRDFVANVSHELRTPIGGLVSLADALEEETDRAVVDRLVQRIRAEAQRLATLIDDLLSLSRIEAGGGSTQRVAVGEVAAAAVERVADAARSAGITLVAGSGPAGTVVGDPDQLLSALTNLLENAIKYSNRGGEVRIGTSVDRHWVQVAVEDRGIGIPADDIDRIFERFYRVDPARSRRTGGTGLGLAIVRHVAVNHGGEVLVSSKEGEGSTFTLRLPRDPREVG